MKAGGEDIARGINTAGAAIKKAASDSYDVADLIRISSLGSDKAYQDKLNTMRARQTTAVNRNGGLLGVGANIDNFEDLKDPKKFAAATLKTGADLAQIVPVASATSSGIKGARLGFKVGADAVISGGANVASDAGRQYQETGKIDPKSLALSFATGAAFPVAGFGAGRFGRKVSNFFDNEAGAKLVRDIARETDENIIADAVRKAVPEAEEATISNLSKDLAKATTTSEVKNLLQNSNPRAPRPTQAVNRDVITSLRSNKNPQETSVAVKALFPELDEPTTTNISARLAQATNDTEVEKVIQEAQARQAEVKATVQEATPTGEQVAPNSQQQAQAEAYQQAVTENPVATQAPEQPVTGSIDSPAPQAVASATDATQVPQARDARSLADDIALRAEESKATYKPTSRWQKLKSVWDPRSAAIDIDKKFAKLTNQKLRNINKVDSLEALIEVSEQSTDMADKWLEKSAIGRVIGKYGRGGQAEKDFNVYRLFMRDLEQRADGRPVLFRDVNSEEMLNFVKEFEARNPEARQDLADLAADIRAVQELASTGDGRFVSTEEIGRARTKKDGSEYQFFTPVQRALPEEKASAAMNMDNVGTLGRQKVLQEFTGSDMPLDPTFDALTDYVETVYRQKGQARVVQKFAERVEQGVVDNSRYIQTGDEAARIKQVKQTVSELREVASSLKKEGSKLKMKTAEAKRGAKTATKDVSNRVREILRKSTDDPDAYAAIQSIPDEDLVDLMRTFNEPDIKSEPNTKRIYDRFVSKSEAHRQLAERFDDLKMDLESVENAKKGLTREMVELRPDPTTGRQTIVGIDANGNSFRIETTPEYATLLQGLNREKMNSALQTMKKVQQPFREAFTGILNPSFQISQAIYNTMMTPIIAKEGVRTLGPRAVTEAIKSFSGTSEFTNLLRANGAIRYGGNLQKLVSDSTADALAAQADAISKIKWNANPVRGWERLSSLGGKLDEAARTSAASASYDAAIRRNLTPEQAIAEAVSAYNNTLPNFSNLSSFVSQADSIFMYAGAGQAGTRTVLRAIKRDPVRVGGRLAIAGSALTAATAYNLAQEQGQAFYKDMQESGKQYVLDNNVVVVLPGARKDPKTGEWTGIIKLPIAPELRPMNSAVWKTFNTNEEGVPTKAYALSVFDFVTGQSRTLNNPLVQTGAGIATGKDPRTGRDIYDETMTPEEKQAAIKKYIAGSLGTPGKVVAAKDGERGQAFLDTFVDKVYGAKGLSDGGKFYKTEDEAIKSQGLNQNELNAYRSTVNPRSKDLAGNEIKDKTFYDSASKASTWLRYPKTFEVSKAINDAAKAEGKPGDPLFDLPPDRLKTVLNMQANFSPGNMEDKAILQLNPWLEDFNKSRSAYFEKVIGEKEAGTDPMGQVVPKASKELSAKLEAAKGLSGKDAAIYYEANPDVTDFYTELETYQRAKRAFLGLPQFDRYPNPTPEVDALMKEYNALPKDNGPLKKDGTPSSPARSAWIRANPDKFALLTDQWNKIGLFNLQKDGALAVYEGIDMPQETIDQYQAGGSGGGGYSKFGYNSGGGKGSSEKTQRQYLSQLLSGVTAGDKSVPNINTKPSRAKIKVKTPSGKGRRFKRIKLT
jgi:uncharacterized protein YukE